MENVLFNIEKTVPIREFKRKRSVFRKITPGKAVALEDINTEGVPARLPGSDKPSKQQMSLSLSSTVMTEFVARNLKNFFNDSAFIYTVLRNGTDFIYSNKVVPPKIKNDAVTDLNEALNKTLAQIKEIESKTHDFLRSRKVKPQDPEEARKYIVMLEYDNLADRKFLIAVQRADNLLYQLNILYQIGGFGLDLIKAEDELAAQRKRIISALLASCNQCRRGRRNIQQAKKDFFDEQEKKRAEKKQREKELEAHKQEQKAARENRVKEAKALLVYQASDSGKDGIWQEEPHHTDSSLKEREPKEPEQAVTAVPPAEEEKPVGDGS